MFPRFPVLSFCVILHDCKATYFKAIQIKVTYHLTTLHCITFSPLVVVSVNNQSARKKYKIQRKKLTRYPVWLCTKKNPTFFF